MDKKHSTEDLIIVKGARTHNLKNITVEMPRNAMIVFTGLSGSGKSSLAFDTIFAEGQRRYVESLSSYARQFLRQMQKPDVDEIVGLSPAISIDQKSQKAVVKINIKKGIQIYDDAIASIKTEGLIGDSYLSLDPGGSGELLKSGGGIIETHPPIDIADLISKYAFGDVKNKQ